MSVTPLTLRVVSKAAEQTEGLGEALGKRLRGGEVIELISDLGGGKTTLVRGLARGAGSQDQVASPTFTVSRIYDSGRLHIHHFDFYRLGEAGIMSEEVAEIISEPDNVVVIEWSDIIKQVMPAERLAVTIKQIGNDMRQIDLSLPPIYGYLLGEPASITQESKNV